MSELSRNMQESRTSPEKEGLKPSAALQQAGDNLKSFSAEQGKLQAQDKATQKADNYQQAAANREVCCLQ